MAATGTQAKESKGRSVTTSVDKILNLKRLTATANGAGWGAIGGAAMILLFELIRKHAPEFVVVDVRTAGIMGTAIGAGTYGVLSRSTWSIRRCLLKSHAMFVDGLVNKTQFTSMQKKCLQRWS